MTEACRLEPSMRLQLRSSERKGTYRCLGCKQNGQENEKRVEGRQNE
jgi:hypothetical protein